MLEVITDDSWAELDKLAREHNHQLWAPTHVIRKEDSIVGGCSIGGVPLVNVFFAPKIKAKDTFLVQDAIEEEVRLNGWTDYLLTLGPESPMYRHASKWGFRPLGNTFLHHKEVFA